MPRTIVFDHQGFTCVTYPCTRSYVHDRGDAFYADVNTLGLEEMHKDTEEGIDKMVEDLEKQ